MIPWLGSADPFPPVSRALREPNGLLAAGADLSPARLLAAYRYGIFPWYCPGEPILWWSPDPRMVLVPSELHVSRSLRRRLKRGDYQVRIDGAFDEVIRGCARPRRGQPDSWITEEMRAAYLRLHRLGYAHSVETYIDGRLAGGLYGVAVGGAFFGESMFSTVSDASKIALVHLVGYLERRGYGVIDCQMSTTHLASLGAREIPRSRFVAMLEESMRDGAGPERWTAPDAPEMFDRAI
jgi:leucyl/phenylalanyl-tRNA--protein transferase